MSTVTPSDFGKINLQNPLENNKLRKKSDSVESSDAPAFRPNIKDLVLSDPVNAAMKSADFDEEKVKRIAEAIKMGNYPLDPRKIAEHFLPLEKLI